MSEHEQGVFNIVALEKASEDIYIHMYMIEINYSLFHISMIHVRNSVYNGPIAVVTNPTLMDI